MLVNRGSCAGGRWGGARTPAAARAPAARRRTRRRWPGWVPIPPTSPATPATTPPRTSRCAPPRSITSRSSTSPPGSCSAPPRPRARTRRCTRARSTCTSGAPTRCASSTWSAAARSSRRSTATGTPSPSARPTPTIERLLDRRETLGVTLSFGEVAVTETVLAYQRRRLSDHASDRPHRARSARRPASPRRRSGSSSTTRSAGRRRPARGAARRAARRRARPDRGAAADRDVRPLGHRRALHQLPSPDRGTDDLHLRRPPGRSRDHPHGVPALRGALPRRPPPDRGVSLPRGAARPACSRPSAATSTSPSRRPERRRLLEGMLGEPVKAAVQPATGDGEPATMDDSCPAASQARARSRA